MIPTDNAQEELAAIRASLARAIESANTQEWPKIVRNIGLRIERVIHRPDRAPAKVFGPTFGSYQTALLADLTTAGNPSPQGSLIPGTFRILIFGM